MPLYVKHAFLLGPLDLSVSFPSLRHIPDTPLLRFCYPCRMRPFLLAKIYIYAITQRFMLYLLNTTKLHKGKDQENPNFCAFDTLGSLTNDPVFDPGRLGRYPDGTEILSLNSNVVVTFKPCLLKLH